MTEQEHIICGCSGTKQRKIEQLFTQGIDTLDKISAYTGANTGCGSCDTLILDLLNRLKSQQNKSVN